MPAAPSATSVRPLRQARPMVSETITADVAGRGPGSRRAAARAEASGSAGSSTRWVLSTLEASMPAAAITKPWWVCTIVVGPRRATTRAVSAASDRGPGRRRAPGRRPAPRPGGPRPSTRSCWSPPARRRRPARARPPAISSARSSPAVTSPMPRTGSTSSPSHHRSSDTGQRPGAVGDHLRRWPPRRSSTAARPGSRTPGTSVAASVVSTSQPSSRPSSARAP